MNEGPHWVRAVADAELLEGDLLNVEVNGEQVLLVRLLGGRVKAYQADCPHQGTLLTDGDWEAESSRLMCSSHLWEFDLTDGSGVNPSSCRLREYSVRSDGEWLDIAIQATSTDAPTVGPDKPFTGKEPSEMRQTLKQEDSPPEDKMVGPVIRGMDADLAAAIAYAIEMDNQGADIQVIDAGGYIRIQVPWECRLTRTSLEYQLGYSYPLSRIEPALAAFAGRMKITDDRVTWYLERRD